MMMVMMMMMIIIIIIIIWNQQERRVIQVTIGAAGTISKSPRQYLSNIPRKYEIKKQKKKPYWALHAYCRKC
jgi:hypothetical protein